MYTHPYRCRFASATCPGPFGASLLAAAAAEEVAAVVTAEGAGAAPCVDARRRRCGRMCHLDQKIIRNLENMHD